MTSCDERRNVAARLRQMADRHDVDKRDVIRAFDDADIRKLADLIDPTCKNKLDELNRMAPVEMRTDNFVCSACGETFCADPDGVNFPIDWAYCPNCGARVVRDDD